MIKNSLYSIKNYFNIAKKSLQPCKEPEHFWRLNIYDAISFLMIIFPVIVIWLVTAFTSDIKQILQYWDGPNYIYAAITCYSIPNDNPWTLTFGYKPSYFACHLPGYPMFIRLCTFFTLGNYESGSFLAIIASNFLVAYSFRRLLTAYHCSSSPVLATCLISIMPFRFVLYRCVVASEPLFIFFISMAMIFYKFDRKSMMMIFVWCCCFTRIEGMAVGFVFGVCYLIRFDIISALQMFLTFVPDVFLVYVHKCAFDEPLAYLNFNSGQQGIMTLKPFNDLVSAAKWGQTYILPDTLFMYFVSLIGIVSILPAASPIGLFALVFYIYTSMLNHLDTSRYMIPCHVFSYVIGFDSFFTRNPTPAVCCLVYPIAIVILAYYCMKQIPSNVCSESFFESVIQASKDNIH